MEEQTQSVNQQTQTQQVLPQPGAAAKKVGHRYLLVILLFLIVAFSLLFFGIKKQDEVDGVFMDQAQRQFLNIVSPKRVKAVPTPKVEGNADSVDVGSADADLQDLNADVQGL